jgi:hypothetical protein
MRTVLSAAGLLALAGMAIPAMGQENSAGAVPANTEQGVSQVEFIPSTTLAGNLVYGADNLDPRPSDLLMTIDSVTPAIKNCIGQFTHDGLVSGLDFNGAGVLYGYIQTAPSANNLVTVSTVTGASTLVGVANPLGQTVTGMTWSGVAGQMFVCDSGGGVWPISPLGVLGARVPHLYGDGSVPFLIDIAAHPVTGVLYGLDLAKDVVCTLVGGVATSLGALGVTVNFSQGMDFDDSNNTLYLGVVDNVPALRGDWGTVAIPGGAFALIGPIAICGSPLGITEFGDFAIARGGADKCKYNTKKSKAKGGCRTCPPVNTIICDSNQACNPGQCGKKLKSIPCPGGGGSCVVKAKGAGCGTCP